MVSLVWVLGYSRGVEHGEILLLWVSLLPVSLLFIL